MSVLGSIKEKVENSKSILIMTHTNPDGDAMGSALGLLSALKKIEKQATVYMPVPNKTFSFLPGFLEIVTEGIDASQYDLCIALDASDLERLGKGREYFEAIEDTIVIDHHITNQSYADINYLNAVASSTCENLIVVLAAMNIAIKKWKSLYIQAYLRIQEPLDILLSQKHMHLLQCCLKLEWKQIGFIESYLI